MRSAVEALYDWLAVEDKPAKSDLIFLFGGAVINIAEKGAQLYAQGMGERIVTTGNTGTFGNPEWTMPIAEVFEDYLMMHGVPKAAILVQKNSMNTREDVIEAMPLLDAEDTKRGVVVLVSRPVHQRRAYATYVEQDPGAVVYNVPCDEPHPNTLEGDAFADVALRCTQEYERLVTYANKGDIHEQPVPPEVKEAYEVIKANLPTGS